MRLPVTLRKTATAFTVDSGFDFNWNLQPTANAAAHNATVEGPTAQANTPASVPVAAQAATVSSSGSSDMGSLILEIAKSSVLFSRLLQPLPLSSRSRPQLDGDVSVSFSAAWVELLPDHLMILLLAHLPLHLSILLLPRLLLQATLQPTPAGCCNFSRSLLYRPRDDLPGASVLLLGVTSEFYDAIKIFSLLI